MYNRRRREKRFFIYQQSQINKVLYNLPELPEIIKDFVVLKKRRTIHVGRCPFCHTLTSNETYFIVSNKGFKCFQCGKGGTNAFGFFMIYFDKPFDKVLQWLNNRYTNIELVPKPSSYSNKRKGDDDNLPF